MNPEEETGSEFLHKDGSRDKTGSQQVVDEEGTVDEKVKRQILEARSRVMEREDLLFVEAALSSSHSRLELAAIWATTVKQYLRILEPLLRSDEIENSEEYYKHRKIGELRLVPPDTDSDEDTVTVHPPDVDAYKFSRLDKLGDRSDIEICRSWGLPPGTDLPEPKIIKVRGLKDIIEMPTTFSASWTVCLDNQGAPWSHEHVTLEREVPPPKTIYEDAVRLADEFRQQAGVGVEIGYREEDFREQTIF